MEIKTFQNSDTPRVSVIIPSSDGDRQGNVSLLLADLEAQDFSAREVILVVGVRPQGKAINLGVERSRGDVLVIMDDDSRVAQRDLLSRLFAIITEHNDVGMVGASIVSPADATPFQLRVARQMPRFSMPVVNELMESDMPCHGCCALLRSVFDDIGGERENILRGLDPDLRQRLRDRRYRVVLAPQASVSHPVPGTWRGLFKMYWRNGLGSAYIQRFHPDLVFDTDESVRWQGKPLRVSFMRRLLRYPLRFCGVLVRGHLIRAMGEVIYAGGFLAGCVKFRREDAAL